MDYLEKIKEHYLEASICSELDWEYNSGGNGINCCEALATLGGLLSDCGVSDDDLPEPTDEQIRKYIEDRGEDPEDYDY